MRVLLDENVDRRLKNSFDDAFEVTTVTEREWSGRKNGELLRAAEREFDALVTMDRNMKHQQNLGSVDLGAVLISAKSNRRRDVEPAMPKVNQALQHIQAGELLFVAT